MNRKNEKKSLGSSSSKILALLSTNRKAIGGTLVLLAIPALLNNLLTPADVSSQESRKSEKSNSQLNSSISTGKIYSPLPTVPHSYSNNSKSYYLTTPPFHNIILATILL